MTYKATDPSGKTHYIKTKRPVNFAIFLRQKDGSYFPHFAKTMTSAKAHWGVEGIGIVMALQE